MLARPSPKVAIFITIIVKFPIMQIVTMVLGFVIIALEYPLPVLKGTALHRSLALRVVLLIQLSSVAVLFYQVSFPLILH
jgi:ATP adenylyltransferase